MSLSSLAGIKNGRFLVDKDGFVYIPLLNLNKKFMFDNIELRKESQKISFVLVATSPKLFVKDGGSDYTGPTFLAATLERILSGLGAVNFKANPLQYSSFERVRANLPLCKENILAVRSIIAEYKNIALTSIPWIGPNKFETGDKSYTVKLPENKVFNYRFIVNRDTEKYFLSELYGWYDPAVQFPQSFIDLNGEMLSYFDSIFQPKNDNK